MRISKSKIQQPWSRLTACRVTVLTALLSIFFGLYLGLWLRHFDSILGNHVELRSPHHNHHPPPHPPHTDTTTSTTTTAFTTTTGVAGKKNKKSSNAVLKDSLSNYWPEGVWNDLIEEGARLQKLNKHKKIIAMEVGMHRAVQCLQAAKAGLEVHCVEPSPKSFERVQRAVQNAPADVQQKVHLYNVAAGGGGSSPGFVPFTSSGGTGDHVGEHDMWTMQAAVPPPQEQPPQNDGDSHNSNKKATEIIQVPSMRLDDIVAKATNKDNNDNDDNDCSVFVVKIDTQGFEPTVLSGLTDSLQKGKIQYLLMEYWPRGMDLLANQPKDTCMGAQVLQNRLVDHGYTLYALSVQAHPKAPHGWKSRISSRPMDNLQDNCRWYFSLEDQLPSEEYKMGYWSDILAVAPTAQFLDGAQTATTRTGLALLSSSQ